MTPSIDQQRQHMQELIEAYDRVGVAHLQLARDAERDETPAFGDYNVNAGHHRTMAGVAFDESTHYEKVMQRFIDRKFNWKKD